MLWNLIQLYIKGPNIGWKVSVWNLPKVDEDLTGPTHAKVAKKYSGANETTRKMSWQKIIEGGSGVWGTITYDATSEMSQGR